MSILCRQSVALAELALVLAATMLIGCSREGHKHPLLAKPRDAALIEEDKGMAKSGASGEGHGGMEHGGNASEKAPASEAKNENHAAMGHGTTAQPKSGESSQKEEGPPALLHLGAKNFFLDQPQKLTLSAEQAKRIGEIKERTAMDMMASDKKIQEAEQQIWKLTSSDRPAPDEIEGRVREVEKLRADQRIAFIRSVSEAANLLTAEQKEVLTRETGPTKPDANKSGKAEEKSEPAHKH